MLSINNDREQSPQFLATPLIKNLTASLRSPTNNDANTLSSRSSDKMKKKMSIKELFKSRRRKVHLDDLAHDDGYHVYYLIFGRIRFLLMVLGLWSPRKNGTIGNWFLYHIYPYLIYMLILYPWTTFVTQEAYWSIPVFLFIVLHMSGFFSYYIARAYFKSDHFTGFITETFIPFYEDLRQFERKYESTRKRFDNENINNEFADDIDTSSSDFDDESSDNGMHSNQIDPSMKISESFQSAITLQMNFEKTVRREDRNVKRFNEKHREFQRQTTSHYGRVTVTHNVNRNDHKNDNKKRNSKFNIHRSLRAVRQSSKNVLKKVSDPSLYSHSFKSIEGTENRLSLALFYEAISRLWKRFWQVSLITSLPIAAVLVIEIVVENMHSSISTKHQHMENDVLISLFVPFNTIVTFVRVFYNVAEFVFMAMFFHFICECHRGDLLIHLHYYDTTDIFEKKQARRNSFQSLLQFYKDMEVRMASIIWDWNRIAVSIRNTSRHFRWWVFVMVILNFFVGVTAVINLTTHEADSKAPQHLEMYLPAFVNLIISFYVLSSGSKVAHLNTTVARRIYFLLATTHFSHISISHRSIGDHTTIIPHTTNTFLYDNNDNDDAGNDKSGGGGDMDAEDDDDDTVDYCKNDIELIDNINDCDDDDDDDSGKSKRALSRVDLNATAYNCADAECSTMNMKTPTLTATQLEIRQQNLYIQAQSVSKAVSGNPIGISVYGLVLSRRLFLGFAGPFVAFFLFCVNTWLPK